MVMNTKNTAKMDTEDRIDEALEDSFPASDPPAWGAIAKHDHDAQHVPRSYLPLAMAAIAAWAGFKASSHHQHQ